MDIEKRIEFIINIFIEKLEDKSIFILRKEEIVNLIQYSEELNCYLEKKMIEERRKEEMKEKIEILSDEEIEWLLSKNRKG